jgi:16S rRNA G1207 methylase RsmC
MKKKPVTVLAPRDSEQLLIDHIDQFNGHRFLCTTIGRAQLASALAEIPEASVTCHFSDIYQAKSAQTILDQQENQIEILCQPDFPEIEFDCVLFPFVKNGTTELTREFLQTGYQRLKLKGRMAASTDNPKDQWLHGEMQSLFSKVTRIPSKNGVVYFATKLTPLKKEKNFQAQYNFKDQENIIHVMTRPGVFSHRKLDAGARALIKVMEIKENDHVLELGCGSGSVSLAALLRAENVSLHAIDSNPRAVQCTEMGASLNGISGLTTELNDEIGEELHSQFDVVLANPPYYSQNQIGHIFLDSGYKALKQKGRIQIVTRKPAWFEEEMESRFFEIVSVKSGNYHVISAKKK